MKNLNIGKAFLAFIIFYVVNIIIFLVWKYLGEALGISVDNMLMLCLWWMFIDLVWLYIVYLFIRLNNIWHPIFPSTFKEIKLKYIVIAILVGVSYTYLAPFLGQITLYLMGFVSRTVSDSALSTFDANMLPALASIIIINPIMEELFFRGFLLKRLSEKYSNWIALFSSSLFFSIAHFGYSETPRYNIYIIVISFFFGILAGSIFLKTKKIIYPIVCHVFANLLIMASRYIDIGSFAI